MNILSTPASFDINDFHGYKEGAIANISYGMFNALSKQNLEEVTEFI